MDDHVFVFERVDERIKTIRAHPLHGGEYIFKANSWWPPRRERYQRFKALLDLAGERGLNGSTYIRISREEFDALRKGE